MPEGKGDGQGWTQVQRGLAVAAGQPRGKEIPPEESLAQQELWHGLAVRRGLGTRWESWDSAAAPSQGLLPTRTDLFLQGSTPAPPTELLTRARSFCCRAGRAATRQPSVHCPSCYNWLLISFRFKSLSAGVILGTALAVRGATSSKPTTTELYGSDTGNSMTETRLRSEAEEEQSSEHNSLTDSPTAADFTSEQAARAAKAEAVSTAGAVRGRLLWRLAPPSARPPRAGSCRLWRGRSLSHWLDSAGRDRSLLAERCGARRAAGADWRSGAQGPSARSAWRRRRGGASCS